MFNKLKLRVAAWIVELRLVKWAHRVEGERFRHKLYQIFDAVEEYQVICNEESSGTSTRK